MQIQSAGFILGLAPARRQFAGVLAAGVLLALGGMHSASADTTYNWNNHVGNATFDTTSANWSTGSGYVKWSNVATDIATFGTDATPGNVTVASTTLFAAGLTFNASGWALLPASGSSVFTAFANGSTAPFTVTLAPGVTASSAVPIAGNNAHGLLVTGGGTFTTTATAGNNFVGGVTITDGATLSTGTATLTSVFGATGYSIFLEGGTLASATDFTVSRNVFLGASGATGGNGAVAQTTTGKKLTLSNPIYDGNTGDDFTISAANVGTVVLTSASNAYTGVTLIQAGTLKLGAAGTIGASSRINVAAGATFDVSDVTGYTVGNQTLTGSGGTISGDLALGAGTTFLADLNVGGPTLRFNGNLDLTASPSLSFAGSADGTDDYTLATFTGTERGSFAPIDFSAAAPGYVIDYGLLFPGSITLVAPAAAGDPVAVPEPATLALLFLGIAGAAGWGTRRRQR